MNPTYTCPESGITARSNGSPAGNDFMALFLQCAREQREEWEQTCEACRAAGVALTVRWDGWFKPAEDWQTARITLFGRSLQPGQRIAVVGFRERPDTPEPVLFFWVEREIQNRFAVDRSTQELELSLERVLDLYHGGVLVGLDAPRCGELSVEISV